MPEEVRIITLFNSMNCGAYLQALALGLHLESRYGLKCSYVDTGARSPEKQLARRLAGDAKRVRPAKAVFDVKRYVVYRRLLSLLHTERLSDSYGVADLLLYGSDEIWNVSREAIRRFPSLWGEGVEGGFRVAYAPTANGSGLVGLPVSDGMRSAFQTFSFLSARDASTAGSLKRLLDTDVPVVLDPTLLLGCEVYRELQGQAPSYPYMLVYTYGKGIREEDIEEIRAYARERGLRLISADQWLDWCDESIPCGPFGFLTLMDGATAVVTDTFHGTAFATIYRKCFVSYARGSMKVAQLLMSLGLESREPQTGSLSACLESTVDYTLVDQRLNTLRRFSESYLEKAVSSWRTRTSGGCDVSATDLFSEVKHNVDLAGMTTFRMGGCARNLWIPRRGDDLSLLPRDPDNTYRVISGGSNILISDEREFPDVISMRRFDDTIESLGGGWYRVGASVRIQTLIHTVNSDGYGGIEELVSVPGLVGGLVCMNASVPSAGICISDNLESVEVFVDGGVRTFEKDECSFAYRKSRFQDGHSIILSATFLFPKQDVEESRSRESARRERCRRMQDSSHPNFGSVFAESDSEIMAMVRRLGIGSGKVRFSKKTRNWLLNGGGAFEDALRAITRVERLHRLAGRNCRREVVIWK